MFLHAGWLHLIFNLAFWAHIGGFLFGVCFAMAMRKMGVERHVAKVIERKVTLNENARIVKAMSLLDEQKPQEAIRKLKEVLAAEPHNLDAQMMLLHCYQATSEKDKEAETCRSVIRLYLSDKNYEAALATFQQLVDGDKAAAIELRDWFEICRWMEESGEAARAAQEYQKVFTSHPKESLAVKALLRSADLYLTKLENKKKATELYRKALDSVEPGSPWEEIIRKGLRQAGAA